MRKWKRVLSILLMGAMLAGNVFVAAPETVRAEETAANRKGFIECKLACLLYTSLRIPREIMW